MTVQVTKRFDANGIGTIDEWFNVGGADKPASILTDDGTTSYINSAATDDEVRFDIDTTFPEKMAFINAVRVFARHRSNTGTTISNTLHVLINGALDRTIGTSPRFSTTTTFALHNSGSLARPGGGQWTEDDFRLTGANRFQWEIFHPSQTNQTWVTESWVEVDYIPLNRTIDLEREVASRRLRLNREPAAEVTLVGGWEHLEGELMDAVAYSHAHGPTHDAKGWGLKDWERGLGRLKRQSIALSMPHVSSMIGDRRRYQTTFWEIFKATIAGDPDIADGIPRLDSTGADREFSRSSQAWVEEVGGSIKNITEAKEKIEPDGELIEEARTNTVQQSSFVNGTTGWNKSETLGAGTFATDTANLLFDSDVSAQSVKMSITTAPYSINISGTTDSLAASVKHTVSVDWEQDNTAATGIFIKNNTTLNWLRVDGSWGAIQNIPLGSSVDSKERDSIVFTTESTAAAHTIAVVFTGSVNGTVHHVFHVQIEIGPWASSRIVTTAGKVTRTADLLQFDNSVGDVSIRRIFPVDKFTCKLKIRPQWAPGDLSVDAHLLTVDNDASNWIRIYVAGTVANDPLRFEYRHGGTTETAFIDSPSITADTEHEVVIRKTSSSGELDLTNGTIDIFLDGTKGTSDTAASDLTEADTSKMTLGSLEDGTKIGNCHLVEVMVSPIVFANVEISGGLP